MWTFSARTPTLVLLCFMLAAGPIMAAPQMLPKKPRPLRHKGFTILPPADKGWFVVKKKSHRLVLGRHGKNKNESYAIIVSAFKLPLFKRNRDFVKYVKSGQNETGKMARFQKLRVVANWVYVKKTICVHYHTVVQDHALKQRSSVAVPMILEIVGYTCKHPDNPRIGIGISISKRYYPSKLDQELAKKARILLKRTRFTKI